MKPRKSIINRRFEGIQGVLKGRDNPNNGKDSEEKAESTTAEMAKEGYKVYASNIRRKGNIDLKRERRRPAKRTPCKSFS